MISHPNSEYRNEKKKKKDFFITKKKISNAYEKLLNL